MKPTAAAAALLLVSACAGAAVEEQVSPVQKVIQLMDGMLNKAKAEKRDEQTQFASYKQFCEDTQTEKTRAIAEADEQIGQLKADIEKYTATAARLTKQISAHDKDIAAWKGDMKAATKVRKIEKEDYDALHKDYSESIDALGRAADVLKKGAQDAPQALLQVSALRGDGRLPPQAQRALEALLEDGDGGLDVSAPEAAGYEFQSHGVIEMLANLNDKFVAERTTLEKEEQNSKHAYDMLMQDMEAQVGQAAEDRRTKSEIKATKLKKKAEAGGTLSDTTATQEADQKYVKDLAATCGQKARDFAQRQGLRGEEIAAIEKAIEIVQSGAVSGNADKHLPSLYQAGLASLAQVTSQRRSERQSRVEAYLSAQAKQLNSRVLTVLATKISEDPFGKVRKLIKDLLVRLMEEANEEAEHKGFCDVELSTNEKTRKEKTEAVEQLHAEVDELTASIAKLSEQLEELAAAVSELDKAMAEATELRQAEKAKNAETISDASKAQSAVAQALTVLKEFYAKAGQATAMLQQEPEIFDEPYTGMQAESGGVVGMLEVIQSDFARLEADTKTAEDKAASEYDSFMADSNSDKEAKNTDIEHMTAKKQDQSQARIVAKEDLEGTQQELDAALEYFDKLRPDCVDSGVSYDDRVARRQEEIESLQEALKILNGDA